MLMGKIYREKILKQKIIFKTPKTHKSFFNLLDKHSHTCVGKKPQQKWQSARDKLTIKKYTYTETQSRALNRIPEVKNERAKKKTEESWIGTVAGLKR